MRPTLSKPARILTVGAVPALLLGAAVAPAHAAGPRITETSLSAKATATAASASLKVTASSCTTVRHLGIAVRDAAGRNVDFPQSLSNARICPSGVTLNGSRAFAAGQYRIFGAYQDASGWHNLAAKTLTVGSAPAPAPGGGSTPAPSAGGSIPSGVASSSTPIWSDEFNGPIDGNRWVSTTSSSYRYGNHNPDDNKLDWLDSNDVTTANGVATFTAQPSSHTLENGQRAWTTGLLTTEGSKQGFQVKTGDYVEARMKLPSGMGAWPALWTWKNGNGEIDSFEYHPDNPNLLELTNHVTSGGSYYTNANAVKPGGWVTIGTKYGANSVDWYVNGVKVYSDGHGVGANWSAYLILNLSLSAGQYHPAPSGSTPITFSVDYLRVYH